MTTPTRGHPPETHGTRRIGLLGATGVGVGAIVGGGILALAGPAFVATGPSAVLAFGLNGLVAVLTALAFAELAAGFPESGGAYTFARRVLSVRAGFGVGWILWSAYIVAAVLYALGFASYGARSLVALWRALNGPAPDWFSGRTMMLALAVGAGGLYILSLVRKPAGGGQLATVGKVVVLAFLVAAGLWAMGGAPEGTFAGGMTPFFPGGTSGLLQAMGVTFIALQGFDLVAAVGGEVRDPERNIPRAMLLSLGCALLIYLPLLIVVSTVGVPAGADIRALSTADPETVVATAVREYLGDFGYTLVLVAAVLAMLSALYANLLAASRVALSMAQDRTLPRILARRHARFGTPVMALYATGIAALAILLMVPDVEAAGSAASLTFLLVFALVHGVALLMGRRSAASPEMQHETRTWWRPSVSVVGLVACVGLAGFQAVAVPSAGAVVVVWLGLGGILYIAIFASRAERVDAWAEAHDPTLAQLRGHHALVLAPIANPASAPPIINLAHALAPPVVGRVLMLNVIAPPEAPDPDEPPESLLMAQQVLREAMLTSMHDRHPPEALMTVAMRPWNEIARVARTHACECLVLGLPKLEEQIHGGPLEQLLNEVVSHVAILRAPPGWRLATARRILVPIGGRGRQDDLRARLLGSLCRTGPREVTFLRVLPSSATEDELAEAERGLRRLAADKAPGVSVVEVQQADDVVQAVIDRAAEADLVVLGLQRVGRRKLFGEVALRIAASSTGATVMLSRRDSTLARFTP